MAIIDNPVAVSGEKVDQTSALQWMLNNKRDYSGVAAGLTSLTELPTFTQPSGITNYAGAFSGCTSLISTRAISLPSYILGPVSMFNGCSSLTNVCSFANVKISSSDYQGATNMFKGCSSLTTLDIHEQFFYTCRGSVAYAFMGCTALRNLNSSNTIRLPQFSVPCDYMFSGCASLPTITFQTATIGKTSTTTATATHLFDGCGSLTSVTAPTGWLTYASDTSYMFRDCASLKTIPYISLASCTNASYMFSGCASLPQSQMSKITYTSTGKITSFLGFLAGCSLITSLPSFDTSAASNITSMCSGCSALVNVPVLDFSSVSSSQYYFSGVFSGCASLSNTSLNNILASLLTATKITSTTYKTLAHIGLTSAQATTCTGLSNWAAASAAGWTTGY